MYYGPKHTETPDDLTLLRCGHCGWVSGELRRATLLRERGFPWYCDDCGERVSRFMHFRPWERAAAYAEWGLTPPAAVAKTA